MRRGVHVKNNKRHSGQGDIYTHKVHINCVIYKYSSPSSFQLSENKKSKCREQLKDPITQPFWRADSIELIQTVAVSHCPLYLQDCTYIQMLVKVYTSAKQDAPPASHMVSDHGRHTHAHTLTHISMLAHETCTGTHVIISVHTPILSHTRLNTTLVF